MEGYSNIEDKLIRFVRKYYTNELIKGGILFFSFGILYLFFTLFIEYVLWLKPASRTILFWIFIAVEVYFLFRFILVPLSKLIGFKNGISDRESSKIIGDHFPEVRDKLLNVMQLKALENHSELLIASIEQKARELQPIPFVKAVNFRTNRKYVKYAVIPVFLLFLLSITGNVNVLSTSFTRVLQHRTAFVPPAPFTFQLVSSDLTVIQDEEYTVKFSTIGTIRPANVLIYFNNERYYLQKKNGLFTYTFTNTAAPIKFYVASNTVVSDSYELNIINTPRIQNISVDLEYPSYIKKKNETITNFGVLLLPEGTRARWNVETKQTDAVAFINDAMSQNFKRLNASVFSLQKKLRTSMDYQISSSNAVLKNYETLSFSIDIIKDAYPMIEVFSELDSLSRNTMFFAGQISDDYGIRTLEIVYYDERNPEVLQRKQIKILQSETQPFYFEFPGVLKVKEGVNYGMYFQVFDNDEVNGSKKTKSKTFTYRFKSKIEVEDELVKLQRDQINSIENNVDQQQLQKEQLQKIQENLQNKSRMNWNDKKNISEYIKRQEGYKKMMERQTDKLQNNLKTLPTDTKSEKEKKEVLKKRIAELKKIEKEQQLLDELKKVANKLKKDDLLNKVKKLAEQNAQQERSLERVLELTKRFYVEQKSRQVAEKLQKLSKEQDSLSKLEVDTKEAQDKIKKEFDAIKKELETLEKDNEKLKEPMQIPAMKEEQKEVDTELENIDEQNAPSKRDAQKKSQKKASDKIQKMGEMMQGAMAAASDEMNEENIETLRLILDNLLKYSFNQEEVMNRFSEISVAHPNFGEEIKRQNMLKSYFEHIDDSLYVLSMRLPKISSTIQKDLEDAHFNLDQSIENFSENRFETGLSNQQYVLTSVNNLADMLSTMLDNLQNPTMSMPGKGKKGGKSFSLPDIIQKQSELLEKMKKGSKKGGQQKGKKPGSAADKKAQGSGTDGELYKLYQEQSLLRETMENALKNGDLNNSGRLRKLLEEMNSLENQILEKGYSSETIRKMQELNYNLLKLDSASRKQNKDSKRKSRSSETNYKGLMGKLFKDKLFYNQLEILKRQSLPLQNNYKKRVRQYFERLDKESKDD